MVAVVEDRNEDNDVLLILVVVEDMVVGLVEGMVVFFDDMGIEVDIGMVEGKGMVVGMDMVEDMGMAEEMV